MRWKLADKIDPNSFKKLKKYDLIIAQLLFNRGIKDQEAAEDFLNPTLEDLHSHLLLPDIDKAVARILEARRKKQKVFIYGDYDVDGVSGVSIMWDYLFRILNMNVLPYIPSRFDEGYGLNKDGLDSLLDQGANLVITVDCGIRDIDLVSEFTAKGIDFIVTDHHLLSTDHDKQPQYSQDAVAVVHPRLPNSKYPFKDICGAAVAWKLVVALDHEIKKFQDELSSIDPYKYLDLVALATITDIMPLVDENRAIVKFGIERMKKTENIGLRSLILDSQIDIDKINTYHFGFVIGPRINAAGRIEHALDAVRLLSTSKIVQAQNLARKLSELNSYRQEQTIELLKNATSKIEDESEEKKLLFVWGDDWPEGIVGLVAGRLQELYYRPVLVASVSDGIATGSARSIKGFDITTAISKNVDLLVRFGGHAQAAGFTVSQENIQRFKEKLEQYAEDNISDQDLMPVLEIEAKLNVEDVNIEFIDKISMLEPFGYKNKTPVFLLENVEIRQILPIGRNNDHVKLKICQNGSKMLEVIGFRMYKNFENLKTGDRISMVGSLDKNVWNGNTTVQFKLKEFRNADE